VIGRRLTLLAVLVGTAAAVVTVAIVVSTRGGDPARVPVRAHDVTAVLRGIPQNGLVLGDPRAPVLLVEFADPQCPFCREYSLSTWPATVQRYVRTGKVRMELRLVGFLGPDSVRADRALLAAALQNRIWDAAARFFALQGQENSGYVTDAFLRGVLGGVRGLDVARAMADRTAPQVDEELGAVRTMQSRYSVNSTPTLLVGTNDNDLRKVSEQSPSPEQLGAILDAELARNI
jgi:protein-disulfide isomerase